MCDGAFEFFGLFLVFCFQKLSQNCLPIHTGFNNFPMISLVAQNVAGDSAIIFSIQEQFDRDEENVAFATRSAVRAKLNYCFCRLGARVRTQFDLLGQILDYFPRGVSREFFHAR